MWLSSKGQGEAVNWKRGLKRDGHVGKVNVLDAEDLGELVQKQKRRLYFLHSLLPLPLGVSIP